MRRTTRFAVLTAVVVIVMGMGPLPGPPSPEPTGEIPEELKGKMPKRVERFVFSNLKSFARSILRDRPPLETLQCGSVIFSIGVKATEFAVDDFPRSLEEWRRTGYLLYEYPLLKDASASLPADFGSDEGVRERWVESAPPGNFFVHYKGPHKGEDGKVISETFLVGCTVKPSPFKRTRYMLDMDAMPDRGFLDRLLALPAEILAQIREEKEIGIWNSRAWQLRFGYASYILATGKFPESVSDLQKVMGKEIEKAWGDEVLRTYAEKFFMRTARKAFEEEGFVAQS